MDKQNPFISSRNKQVSMIRETLELRLNLHFDHPTRRDVDRLIGEVMDNAFSDGYEEAKINHPLRRFVLVYHWLQRVKYLFTRGKWYGEAHWRKQAG